MRNAGSIGGGIVLMIIGAVIAFALEVEFGFMDKNLVGYLLIGGGAILFIIGLVSSMSHKKSRTEVRNDPVTGSQVRESEQI